MKKILLFVLIFVSISGLLVSQNIMVTNPNAAAKWIKSRNHVITWDKSGEMAMQVKIILFRADKEVLVIADSTDNDGAFSWTVPADLIPGKYTIHVLTPDESVSDDSDDFQIESAPAIKSIRPAVTGTAIKVPPQVKIINPNGGESWTVGTEEEITWEYSGLSGNVNLMLFKKDKEGGVVQIVNIARDIPINSRSYTWKVGKHASGKATQKSTSEKKDQKQTGGASTGGATDKKTTEGSNLGVARDTADSASTKKEKTKATAPIYVSPIPDLRCRIGDVELKTAPLIFPPGLIARRARIRFSLRYDTSGKEETAPKFKIRIMLVDTKINKVIKSDERTIDTLPSNEWISRFSKVFERLLKGPYTVIVLLDPDNEMRESNEDNNKREKQFKFGK